MTRVPHAPQNRQSTARPLSESRVQRCNFPRTMASELRGTVSDMPKALEDCFWHSVQ
jgi:hypothetical protein